ncbi:YdaS family helix-turn-helix protein [Comamonas sp. HJ-2]
MHLAQTLIDRAVNVCGSAAELARRLEIYPADVTNLKKGKRPLSPEVAAEIAEIAGMDARQAAIDAIIERNAANRKGALLADILGKGQAVGAAAMLGISYNGDSTIDTATIKNDSAVVKKRIHRIY